MALLSIHPVRQEDLDLLDRWLRARSGIEPEPITIAELYRSDNAPPQRFWNDVTCKNIRSWLLSFARRARVPLREVGLLPGGLFTTESVREEIQLYAMDFAERNAARLAQRATLAAHDEQRKKILLPWRTPAWNMFVDAGTEFYNWLERQGLRPRFSNPFLDIVRLPAVSLKQEIVVPESWYKRIFDYRPKSLKQHAVIMLLANGFRCQEIAHAQAADFTYSPDGDSTLRVIGKGNKVRTVYLYDQTAIAVYHWLRARHLSASPWLFPSYRAVGQPSTRGLIRDIVRRLCLRVFPHPDDARIRRRITPHKFRHYFTSNALHQGMKPSVVQAQLGHASQHMTKQYAHLDPEWIRKEIQAINNGDMLNVPRNGGTPHLLRRRDRLADAEQRNRVPLW